MISDILKNKIPLLDDVIYFIPDNANTLNEYKKVLLCEEENKIKNIEYEAQDEYTENIINNEDVDEEEVEFEAEEENIELEFNSIVNFLPSLTEKENKKTQTAENISNTKVEYIKCESLDFDKGIDFFTNALKNIQNQKKSIPNKKIENKEDLNNSETEEDDSTKSTEDDDNGSGSLNELSMGIGATCEIDVKDLLSSTANKEVQYQEAREEYPIPLVGGTLDEEADFINKIKEFSEEDDSDDFASMVCKIRTLDNTEEEDLISMMSKIKLKEIKNEDSK